MIGRGKVLRRTVWELTRFSSSFHTEYWSWPFLGFGLVLGLYVKNGFLGRDGLEIYTTFSPSLPEAAWITFFKSRIGSYCDEAVGQNVRVHENVARKRARRFG